MVLCRLSAVWCLALGSAPAWGKGSEKNGICFSDVFLGFEAAPEVIRGHDPYVPKFEFDPYSKYPAFNNLSVDSRPVMFERPGIVESLLNFDVQNITALGAEEWRLLEGFCGTGAVSGGKLNTILDDDLAGFRRQCASRYPEGGVLTLGCYIHTSHVDVGREDYTIDISCQALQRACLECVPQDQHRPQKPSFFAEKEIFLDRFVFRFPVVFRGPAWSWAKSVGSGLQIIPGTRQLTYLRRHLALKACNLLRSFKTLSSSLPLGPVLGAVTLPSTSRRGRRTLTQTSTQRLRKFKPAPRGLTNLYVLVANVRWET